MRAAIFCDLPGVVARALIDAAFAEVDRRSDFAVVALVTANPTVGQTIPREVRLRRLLSKAMRPATNGRFGGPPAFDIARAFARHDIPTFVAAGSVNDPSFLAEVIGETNPDLLLNLNGVQILEQSTLDRFRDAVNYHDGLLPKRAGRAATSQSLYLGDATTGFTFHRMTARLDAGPVLVQGSVSTEGNARQVIHRKSAAAADAFGEVLDAVARGDVGEEQQGERNYHSVADRRALTVIDDPSTLTMNELLRRDRAFTSLWMPVAASTEKAQMERVTSLRTTSATAAYAFETSDGRWLRPSSIDFLPTRLTLALRRGLGVYRRTRRGRV